MNNEVDPLVQRINELSKIQKTVGLSELEKEEQARLRAQYLKRFRESMRIQLESIEFTDDK